MRASFFSDLDRTAPDEEHETQDNSFFSDLPKPPSKIKSFLSAALRGPLKVASGINPLQPSGPIPPSLQKRLLEENLPIRPEHEPIERATKIGSYAALGPEGLLAKVAQTAGGTLLGEAAEKAGSGEFGQSILEGVGMGLPGLATSIVKRGAQSLKTTAEVGKSGLPKIQAENSKLSKFATISKERHQAVVEKLNEEASKLTKKSVEKHLPISKEIEKGFDFENKFNVGFQNLRKSAEHANPRIDITPVSELIENTIEKYRGIPKPNPEAVKVIQEMRAFRSKPQTSLNNLLKIYRDNNKKIKNIYETSRITGKQQEYVDFLLDMNRSISKSFEHTLPENSAWINQFKDLNKEYKVYQDAQKTLGKLRGFISGIPKPAEIERLANHPQTQARLSISMGEEGAQEIIQIAKDLKQARQALSKIKKSELTKYDAAFPLYFLVPYLGKALGIYKGVQAGRYFYGWLLSTQSRRGAYKEALSAFLRNDLEAYKKATLKLTNDLDSMERQ